MHTYNATGGTRFHYNSDRSGDVIIIPHKGAEIEVPMEDVLQFVAELVRQEKIRQLENVSGAELLGFRAPARMF